MEKQFYFWDVLPHIVLSGVHKGLDSMTQRFFSATRSQCAATRRRHFVALRRKS
jgi:hypothetical protein